MLRGEEREGRRIDDVRRISLAETRGFRCIVGIRSSVRYMDL